MSFVHQNTPVDAPDPMTLPPPPFPLSASIISRFVDTSPHGLVFHILEALPTSRTHGSTKLILLVHGFPDVAYSWRKVLPQLAGQGYHAVAYDLRGFGRTFSRQPIHEQSFRPITLVRDALTLVRALGYDNVSCVVGHDFGTVTAALCALIRPDVFKSVVLMSHPVRGPPALPFSTSPSHAGIPKISSATPINIHQALSQLPTPKKHYQRYYCTDSANDDMTLPAGSALHDFMRGYFHLKSADWNGNDPQRLASYTAEELDKMPGYYIMNLQDNMRQAVARDMANEDAGLVEERASRWLNEEELAFCVNEWSRTTFQGGLNWYQLTAKLDIVGDMLVWDGVQISVPISFLSGKQDWGSFQHPGALETLENGKFVEEGKYRGTVLVDGAGHWVNQEQPDVCAREIVRLAQEVDSI